MDEWIYAPGLPANVTAPQTSSLFERVAAEAAVFRDGRPADRLETENWSDIELNLFLQLAGESVLTRIAEVDAHFGLSMRRSPSLVWLTLVIRSGYASGRAGLERVLLRGGPNSWMVVLYSELVKSAWRDFARATYGIARERYHPWVQAAVDEIFVKSSEAVFTAAVEESRSLGQPPRGRSRQMKCSAAGESNSETVSGSRCFDVNKRSCAACFRRADAARVIPASSSSPSNRAHHEIALKHHRSVMTLSAAEICQSLIVPFSTTVERAAST